MDYFQPVIRIFYYCRVQQYNYAAKHYAGIQNAIKELCKNPYANAVRHEKSLQRYGQNVRRVNYKKMAIIYTINGAIVNVHRIITASMITDNC